jgi:hypothetical protein
MSLETQAIPGTRGRAVRGADRAWDLLAVLLLSGGLVLFAFGRISLGSLARGTYDEPVGVSWVSRAEHHDAQTRWGGWLIGAGLLVGTVAAGRHALARRHEAR